MGTEAEVALEGRCVGVGGGHIAGLHGYEAFVGFEVVVGGQYACGNEFFLQYGDEVEQILGVAVAYVIYGIGGYGQAIGTCTALWGVVHDSLYAFYYVIDVGEVATAIAIVEYLDGAALTQLVGEAEVCHVGTAGGPVNGEEAQTG